METQEELLGKMHARDCVSLSAAMIAKLEAVLPELRKIADCACSMGEPLPFNTVVDHVRLSLTILNLYEREHLKLLEKPQES